MEFKKHIEARPLRPYEYLLTLLKHETLAEDVEGYGRGWGHLGTMQPREY